MKSFAILFTCTYKYNSALNKYNNKNDDSWINYKGNAVTNKYNRFK
ncbi:hypothetical protein [Spiroplasma endosymbiont of Tipula paludosa]